MLNAKLNPNEGQAVQAERDLAETHEPTTTSASATEARGLAHAEDAAATGAGAGEGRAVGRLAGEPGLEAFNALRKTAADAAAVVRDQIAAIGAEMSRAGEAVQRFGANFDRAWQEWSDRFLRNEAKTASNPGLESPWPTAAHWDLETGDGSTGHRPGELADSHIQPAERMLGTPLLGTESGAAGSPNQLKSLKLQLPAEVAPHRLEAGLPPIPDPVALAGFTPDDANPDRSATGKHLSLADVLNQTGNLEAAQANLLLLLEQSIAGHQRTLDQAAKLLQAQAGKADFTLTLLGNAYQQIEAVHARMEQLEAQHGHSRNVQISG